MTQEQLVTVKARWADAMWEASQENYSQVQRELEDLLAVIREIQIERPVQPLWRSLDVTLMATDIDRQHPYYSQKFVLVTDGIEVTVARCLAGFNPPQWRDINRGTITLTPTHWAPLPKLPDGAA